MSSSETNLDRICAEYGKKLAEEVCNANEFNAKKAEILITKALCVLQDQGMYAFALFCQSRPSSEDPGAKKMELVARELLKTLNFIGNDDFLDDLSRKDSGLLTRLDELMLAIQLLEKSLIYARFYSKALKEQ